MRSDNVPLIEGCHTVDFDQMWSDNVPLIGGLCHAVDFNQIWSNVMLRIKKKLQSCLRGWHKQLVLVSFEIKHSVEHP